MMGLGYASLQRFNEQVRKHYLALDSTLNEDSIIDYTVSYDGTWQKRGFSSLYGSGIVIELYTELVVDYEIISKFCYACVNKKKTMDENSVEFKKWLCDHQSKNECQ